MFKSFDISGDTKLLEKLEKDGDRFVMIIKKHWIYSIIISWRIFFVILIACVNVYLLAFGQINPDTITISIATLLSLNVIWWLIIVAIYIGRFRRIQGNKPYVEDIYFAIAKSKHSDEAFVNFFNQTILLLILLFIITIFTLFTSITSIFLSSGSHFSFGIINAFLLIIQLGLFYGYLNAMINQEMDFKVVVPGQILFYNQRGVFGDSQSMNADKIKTINATHPGLFSSFINYGNIIVLTEGDQGWNGQMDMDYIGDPMGTVKEIQRVLAKDFSGMEQDVNLLLQKFSAQIGIENIDTPENKERLREFVKNNDSLLQEIFKNGDVETKQEVRELYILLQE
ncbi:hypothetical protein AUK10_04220 [Candidatus Gracilibacteria bacterium CG2_30_37_12]|nr:MAG: hypothetical protein AUK10_04220 [Candidatus Gracilibacteria bacterium CG2_30_37_12]